MEKRLKKLTKPNSFRTQFIDFVAVYEELMAVNEPKDGIVKICAVRNPQKSEFQ